MAKPAVDIFTDGACSGNPGPGGWAAILVFGDKEKACSGFAAQTTNNRMELTAAIEGLARLNVACKVRLHSDSAYLVNAFNQGWIDNWQKTGWKNAAGQPVSNLDLWQKLLSVMRAHDVTYIKVKGHADNEMNNRCDKMAVNEIKKNTTA